MFPMRLSMKGATLTVWAFLQEWDFSVWRNGQQANHVAAKPGSREKLSWSPGATLGSAKKLLLTWLAGVRAICGFTRYHLILFFNNIFYCLTGARVILACRDMDRANKAAEEVKKRSGNVNVIVKKLDLASLQSVRHLAKDILVSEKRLDILINNAGRYISLREHSND